MSKDHDAIDESALHERRKRVIGRLFMRAARAFEERAVERIDFGLAQPSTKQAADGIEYGFAVHENRSLLRQEAMRLGRKWRSRKMV